MEEHYTAYLRKRRSSSTVPAHSNKSFLSLPGFIFPREMHQKWKTEELRIEKRHTRRLLLALRPCEKNCVSVCVCAGGVEDGRVFSRESILDFRCDMWPLRAVFMFLNRDIRLLVSSTRWLKFMGIWDIADVATANFGFSKSWQVFWLHHHDGHTPQHNERRLAIRLVEVTFMRSR